MDAPETTLSENERDLILTALEFTANKMTDAKLEAQFRALWELVVVYDRVKLT